MLLRERRREREAEMMTLAIFNTARLKGRNYFLRVYEKRVRERLVKERKRRGERRGVYVRERLTRDACVGWV